MEVKIGEHIQFIASRGMTSRSGSKRKFNYVCTDYRCSYNSRNWAVINDDSVNQIESKHSMVCPIHGAKLLNVGECVEIPQKRTKERKYLIEYFLKH